MTKTLYIARPPLITDTRRVSGSTDTGITLSLPQMSKNTSPDSQVTISVSDSPLQNPERVIAALIAYPYGCIEQTISSTLPNAIAISLGSTLGIKVDTITAKKNLEAGIEKILKMQDASGGWKYWENDTSPNAHITPYVIRSLYEFRKLGVQIPDEVISRGLEYIANSAISVTSTPSVDASVSSYQDMDSLSEIFATLARANHPRTKEIQKYIDTSKLSRHGHLMYSVGLASLGQLDDTTKQSLKSRMSSRNSESYWYWDDTADLSIYARLLGEAGDRQAAANIVSELLRGVDLESYYISTQSRIQLFMTLIELSNGTNSLSSFQIATGNLRIPVNSQKGVHRYSYDTRRSLVGKILDIS